jgi:hypothetical protein
MKGQGYTLYCNDPQQPPPVEDASELSLRTRAAGVAFAAVVAINAANCFSSRENVNQFCRSLGQGIGSRLREMNSGLTWELVLEYSKVQQPPNTTKIVNLANSGTGDFFGAILQAVANRSRGESVGFQRSGVLGFDLLTVPLAEETVSKIQQAAREFGW